jgi:hypothetical protein
MSCRPAASNTVSHSAWALTTRDGIILLDTGYIGFAGEFAASPVFIERGPHELFGSDADLTAFCTYFQDP